jgi:uncharacterized protein YcbX
MRVAGIWRYPVKSLQGEPLSAATVEHDGLAGDRQWGIRDERTGRILTARRRPELLMAVARLQDGVPAVTLPGGTEAVGPGAQTDALLSDWLGTPATLVTALREVPGRAEFFEDATDDTSRAIEWTMPEGRYVDAAALLVLTTASLRTGESLHPDGDWQPRRFRPNILVEATNRGAEHRWVEDGWVGQALQVGEAVLGPSEGCVRCTMVTRPQPGLGPDREIFRTLARHHGARFGAWCEVSRPGAVAVGDPVSLSVPHAG